MTTIEKTIEVSVPVRTAYNQWTQFEQFPRFMEGVKEVQQLDDKHLRWRAEIAGKEVEWTSEITQQVPDQRIGWRSTSGAQNAGSVSFLALADNRTQLTLHMVIDPRVPRSRRAARSASSARASRATSNASRTSSRSAARKRASGAARSTAGTSSARRPAAARAVDA
jgi:uncharacterized membrane protein